MPEASDTVPVRYVDVAAPWLGDVGGDSMGTRLEAAAIARIAMRYDETAADLVHDEEYEAVLFPLEEHLDVARVEQVDYDDRDLRPNPPDGAVYRLTEAKIKNKTFWTQVERELRDHLVRNLSIELPANKQLKLYGRPGETAEEFEVRCLKFADDKADAEIAKLRDKYETRVDRLRDQIAAAEDKIDLLEEQAASKRNSELLSTAGSVLGGLLGGKKRKGGLLGGLLRDSGSAARRRGGTKAAAQRVDAAENKLERLTEDLEELELDLEEDVTEIDAKWMETAKDVTTITVGLEKTDVKVTQLVLAWVPVS